MRYVTDSRLPIAFATCAVWLWLAPGAAAQTPTVSGAEPSAVQVPQGGGPVAVTLSGQNLGALDGLNVLTNGRKARGLEASWKSGGSATQRVVLVSASKRAAVGARAVLQISFTERGGGAPRATTFDAATLEVVEAARTWYRDMDGDGFGDPNVTRTAATQPADHVPQGGDCNDSSAIQHPGLAEVADGVDNDCDGEVDEGLTRTWYRDMDGDGFGDPNVTQTAATQPAAYTSVSGDCVDDDPNIFPGAEDHPEDGTDSDCDGFDD